MQDNDLDAKTLIRYASHVFKALAHCHSQSIVHCDMKPANLLVHPEARTLKLADFGESDLVGRVLDRTFFSRWWRPPEVIFGERARAFHMDVWAAGAVVGEMVGRTPLFNSSGTHTLLARILRLVDPEKPEVFHWERIIGSRSSFCVPLLKCAERCLRWDPGKRSTAQQLAEFLTHAGTLKSHS